MPIQPADSSAEYVLVYHYPVYEKDPKKIRVPKGSVVTNVIYKPVDGTLNRVILGGATELEFTVKKTGETFTTNYGYMFALNTPENLARLAEVDRLQTIRDEAERRLAIANDKVDKIAGPFEGTFHR